MADNQAQPSSPLRRVPLELLLRITYWLNTQDLGSFRLTCHYIETMLFNSFAEEFFSRKQFMVTDFSLQALIDISKSRMAPRLRRLQFGLEQLKRECAFHDSERVVEMYADQAALWNSGAQVEMLREALAGLENLQDVVLRDFDSVTRFRDYPNTTWHSYGYNTATGEGVDFSMIRRTYGSLMAELFDPPIRIFGSLLHALGKAKRYPRGIEIMFRHGNNLSDASFDIPRFLQPSVIPVLQNLEKLHLSVALGRGRLNGEPSDTSGAVFLCKFLSHTRNLKNLRINGVRSLNPGLDHLLSHMADSTLLVTDSQSGGGRGISLPHLEELSLGMMEVENALLLRLIKALAPSLQSLEFWRVIIEGKMDDSDLDLGDEKPKTPLWVAFCNSIIRIPELQLHHIMLGCLEDSKGGRGPWGRGRVDFEGRGDKVAYTGSDWKRFISDTIPSLKYSAPPKIHSISSIEQILDPMEVDISVDSSEEDGETISSDTEDGQ